jgi:biotin-dependent carboxylase-like uncharacterized protein
MHPGFGTRVVDAGRPHTRALGVPVGGAADRRSFTLGNALVGNEPDAAALEIAVAGPRVRAEVDLACVVFGAPFVLASEGRRLQTCKTFNLPAGAELHIAGTTQGQRAYLCVHGGLQTPVVLDSRSGLEPIHEGDVLPCSAGYLPCRFVPHLVPTFPDAYEIRVVSGPQHDWFDEAEFLEQQYTVTPASNRMGLRLQGRPLKVPARELVSEPVAPGAVQVTRDGGCIVLGCDGQTIGGYPKIAHVIDADLDLLGQLRPGDRVRFLHVTLDAAFALGRQARAEVHEWLLRLRLSLDGFGTARTLREA